MLILPFYIWYLIEWLIRLVVNFKMAYMSVSFEREAYRNDDNNKSLMLWNIHFHLTGTI